MRNVGSFFVVGVGRSGTSLLQSMLAAHSALAVPPETAFLRRYAAVGILSRMVRGGASRSDIVNLLEADPRLLRVPVSYAMVVDEAAEEGQLTDISVYRCLLSQYARSVNKPGVGDKDPRMIEYLDILQAAYPEANVVQIIRDPRDVLASKKKADWSSRYSSLRHVFAYRVQLMNGRREGLKQFGDRYHEIVYEALLAEPEEQLRALCEKFGIPYESGMLKFSKAAESLVAPDEMGWKQETMGPLLKGNHGKWRESLTDVEVALVERSCATAIRAFDYVSSDAWGKLGAIDRLRVRFLNAVIAVAEPVYRVYRRMKNGIVRRES